MDTLTKNITGVSESEFLAQYDPAEYERFSVSVDTVVFSVDSRLQTQNFRKLDEQKLTVLLVKRDTHPYFGKWALPGGFVGINEPLESEARRILRDKTGLEELYIEQLYTFGESDRDPRMRIISCAYLSLIDRSKYILGNNQTGLQTAWFEIEFAKDSESIVMKSGDICITISVKPKLTRNGKIETSKYIVENGSSLAFDHASLILEGLMRLRGKIDYTDIVFNLMPERFTITQLQQIYEIVLGEKLLAPLFRRKIAEKLIGTDSYTQEKGHRPSQLFTYKNEIKKKEG